MQQFGCTLEFTVANQQQREMIGGDTRDVGIGNSAELLRLLEACEGAGIILRLKFGEAEDTPSRQPRSARAA